MKYIKYFEKNYMLDDLKKYMICKEDNDDDDDPYVVIEYIRPVEDSFSIVLQILTFSKKNNNVTKSPEITINAGIIKNRIVFQSDDINEIKTQLDLLQTNDKYNL